MTSVRHPAGAGSHRSPAEHDAVIGALGGLGEQVDCRSLRRLSLEGPQVLWLVVGGALDLFAVDAAEQGHWHFLGRLEPGTLLLGPVEGPRHTLIGRPLQECVLRRILLRELFRPEYADAAAYDGQHCSWYDTGDTALSLLEHAVTLGVGRSRRVLFEAPLDGRTTVDDILSLPVSPAACSTARRRQATCSSTVRCGRPW